MAKHMKNQVHVCEGEETCKSTTTMPVRVIESDGVHTFAYLCAECIKKTVVGGKLVEML